MSAPSRRLFIVRRHVYFGPGRPFVAQYFDAQRGMWWEEIPNATTFASQAGAFAACQEHELPSVETEIVALTEHRTLEEMLDDEEGEWWKRE